MSRWRRGTVLEGLRFPSPQGGGELPEAFVNTGRSRYPSPRPLHAANAKRMRRNLTPAEKKLWYALRHSLALQNTHFRRQVPLGPFISDFCCLASRPIVEVDGGQHFTDQAENYDNARTAYLTGQGFKVLRFSNYDVLRAIDDVVATIRASLENRLIGAHLSRAPPYPADRARVETEF